MTMPEDTQHPSEATPSPATVPPPVPPPPAGLTRREALARLTTFGLAALGTSGVALLLHDRQPAGAARPGQPLVRDYRVAGDERSELVFGRTAKGASDGPRLVRMVMEALGGMGRFVRRGERVVIKPNVGWDRNEQQAANTNPAVVATLVQLCQEAGAAQVVVTDVSCNDARRAFTRSGVGLAAQQAGARVILPDDEEFRQVAMGGVALKEWPVLRALLEADRVINVPIVKHHSLSGLTSAMKNLYGIIGGRRNLLHQQIHQSIFDLCHFCRPTLTVVDALRVLVRNGPQGGSLNDVEEVGQLAASTDVVAADAWSARFLKLSPHELGYLKLAHGVLGRSDLQQVREVG